MPKTYYDSELTGAQIEDALEAIHGVVTPSNNGKVLYIDNGQIKAASASRWGHGAVLEPLSVTANGDYTPPTGTDGFDEVHVAVPSATLTTKSITQNGTYNASQDDADGYSSVTVAVPGGVTIEPLEVTQNGTYNPPSGVDGYAPVTVNVSGGTVLPSGYTQKQYLEASGTQYIDTGIKAQGGCYAEVEFEFSSSVSGWHSIISGENANVNKSFKFFHNGMTHGTVQNGSNYYDFSKSFQINQKYKACVSNGLVIDGEFFQKFNKSTFTSNNNIALFANITGSATVEAYFTGRIYSCKMWIGGVITRDFIPCVRDSDDAAGMYDIVNDVFYANAGTGSFVYA